MWPLVRMPQACLTGRLGRRGMGVPPSHAYTTPRFPSKNVMRVTELHLPKSGRTAAIMRGDELPRGAR